MIRVRHVTVDALRAREAFLIRQINNIKTAPTLDELEDELLSVRFLLGEDE